MIVSFAEIEIPDSFPPLFDGFHGIEQIGILYFFFPFGKTFAISFGKFIDRPLIGGAGPLLRWIFGRIFFGGASEIGVMDHAYFIS